MQQNHVHHPMAVTVLLPVFNGERFLTAALESVLGQTFEDFEFVIVNDGSTDSTPDILEYYASRDRRIRLMHQEHLGLPAALNAGLRRAQHELIARIDADDRMLPDRLRRQLWFLERNPQVTVACSYGYFIDVVGKRMGKCGNPIDVERGRQQLAPTLFVEIVHPSVMMRRTPVIEVGGYREDLSFGEDRDLWGRLVTAGFNIACQQELLVEYRLHTSAMSACNIDNQRTTCDYIDYNIVQRLRREPELSYEEFLDQSQPRGRVERWKKRADVFAKHSLRTAMRHYAERRWVSFAMFLGCALTLHPRWTLKRIMAKTLAS